MKSAISMTIGLVLVVSLLGCGGPTFVRGSEMKELDNYAMSTGLDKRDLEQLFDENIKALMESAIVEKWKAEPEPPVVSVFPIRNETSEHVRGPLDALLSKMESKLVNSGIATIVDHDQQDALIEEVKKQQGGAFDEAASAKVGRQLGAKYFVTGKVYDSAERTSGERRVQYFLFMKVVEIETSAMRWSNEANLTKGLVD